MSKFEKREEGTKVSSFDTLPLLQKYTQTAERLSDFRLLNEVSSPLPSQVTLFVLCILLLTSPSSSNKTHFLVDTALFLLTGHFWTELNGRPNRTSGARLSRNLSKKV